MEKIQVRPDSAANHFAIAALVKASPSDGSVLIGNVPPGRGYLEVELKVNGVEVPFAATVEDLYQRLQQNVAEQAAELALKNATLGPLYDSLQQVEHEIREKIEKAFGVTLRRD